VLTLHPLEPAAAVSILDDHFGNLSEAESEAFCKETGLFGFVVEDDELPVGFAVARSHPQTVVVSNLEGDNKACKFLLRRLMSLAGERDVSVWCPAASCGLGRLLGKMGVVLMYQTRFQHRPAQLYRWNAFGQSPA